MILDVRDIPDSHSNMKPIFFYESGLTIDIFFPYFGDKNLLIEVFFERSGWTLVLAQYDVLITIYVKTIWACGLMYLNTREIYHDIRFIYNNYQFPGSAQIFLNLLSISPITINIETYNKNHSNQSFFSGVRSFFPDYPFVTFIISQLRHLRVMIDFIMIVDDRTKNFVTIILT